MDNKLAHTKSSGSRGDARVLTEEKMKEMMPQVPDWEIVEEDGAKKLRRDFEFGNFVEALQFANEIGEIAEEQGHHPIIILTWGRATITWYTHDIKGLHENDFLMAAKSDKLYSPE